MSTPTIIVIGSGIIGLATAYYLAKNHRLTRITLVDRNQPMSFTSAQSGENYRNWWPHPTMVDFTNRSIDLMEEIAKESGNRINMNRRGYALATRETDIDDLVAQLHDGLGVDANELLRFHTRQDTEGYASFTSPAWEDVPMGVDIVQNQALIRSRFPSYAEDIKSVIHIRRGGDISGQQLGMFMLENLKEVGATRLRGNVAEITEDAGFRVSVAGPEGHTDVRADVIVNCAGPFANQIAQMMDVDLPLHNVFQQKIAFEDLKGAIPRTLPFSIDLDRQSIDWTDEERLMLREDPDFAYLADEMPGAIHCRPDGGDAGRWLKLGWAFNETQAAATWEPPLDEDFPDIVLRGASRLQPALKAYLGRLPRHTHHYGGWYTMTEENWPLIGEMGPDGAFINCAHSGFGTMAACAAGELCAAIVAGVKTPDYARDLSLARYEDSDLVAFLRSSNRGVL